MQKAQKARIHVKWVQTPKSSRHLLAREDHVAVATLLQVCLLTQALPRKRLLIRSRRIEASTTVPSLARTGITGREGTVGGMVRYALLCKGEKRRMCVEKRRMCVEKRRMCVEDGFSAQFDLDWTSIHHFFTAGPTGYMGESPERPVRVRGRVV